VIIHHEPRPDGSRQMPEVGIVIPAHACALGKAMLAYLPDQTEELLAGDKLRSMTSETVIDAVVLRKQLEEVARDALATEREEAVLGEAGLAAPIFDASGLVVGAIGIVLPAVDWAPADATFAAVREAARNISRELGAGRWPVPPR
jgi:DNA-binding IclR family transcriptional regulator